MSISFNAMTTTFSDEELEIIIESLKFQRDFLIHELATAMGRSAPEWELLQIEQDLELNDAVLNKFRNGSSVGRASD